MRGNLLELGEKTLDPSTLQRFWKMTMEEWECKAFSNTYFK